jgi:hypothetical protein
VKRGVALLLILLFCGKFIYTSFWLIYFHINQQEIIRLSCENKNRPELKCNGKCYLAKQLRKADFDLAERKTKQETQRSLIKQLELENLYLPATFKLSEEGIPEMSDKILAIPYFCPKSRAHLSAIYHPPIFKI